MLSYSSLNSASQFSRPDPPPLIFFRNNVSEEMMFNPDELLNNLRTCSFYLWLELCDSLALTILLKQALLHSD